MKALLAALIVGSLALLAAGGAAAQETSHPETAPVSSEPPTRTADPGADARRYRYTLDDGDTLKRGRAALMVRGGYPYSSLAYLAVPTTFVQLGVEAVVDYTPGFSLGVPVKVQMLESPDERWNLALSFSSAFYATFDSKETGVSLRLSPGVVGGVRVFDRMNIFALMTYPLDAPLSPSMDFRHALGLAFGVEIPVAPRVNLVPRLMAEFWNYRPDDFLYGGSLGVNIALW